VRADPPVTAGRDCAGRRPRTPPAADLGEQVQVAGTSTRRAASEQGARRPASTGACCATPRCTALRLGPGRPESRGTASTWVSSPMRSFSQNRLGKRFRRRRLVLLGTYRPPRVDPSSNASRGPLPVPRTKARDGGVHHRLCSAPQPVAPTAMAAGHRGTHRTRRPSAPGAPGCSPPPSRPASARRHRGRNSAGWLEHQQVVSSRIPGARKESSPGSAMRARPATGAPAAPRRSPG